MQLSITVRCIYEDQLVKVRVLGRFQGFYTVMLTVRAVMTFRSSKVVEMKGMIITLSEKKNLDEKYYFFVEKSCFL